MGGGVISIVVVFVINQKDSDNNDNTRGQNRDEEEEAGAGGGGVGEGEGVVLVVLLLLLLQSSAHSPSLCGSVAQSHPASWRAHVGLQTSTLAFIKTYSVAGYAETLVRETGSVFKAGCA